MSTILATPEVHAHRQQFPALANKVYFNFGGQGPLPREAMTAIATTYETVQQQGPFSGKLNAWLTEQTAATRAAIAAELGVATETITLTENVTAGCNIALWGIDWHRGDRILMTDCEHPGVIAIVEEIARREGVAVTTCPIMATLNGGDPVAVIEQHLQPATRLVVLSHLLWNTGQVLPLAEIVERCHSAPGGPVPVLVDAAQSVGSLPLNLSELAVDYYAFTGHKWLCGPAGVGGLYVRPEAASLSPTFIGWRGLTLSKTGKPTGFKSNGQRFEVATSAYPLYAGLRRAIALHPQWGTVQERYERMCQLSEYLWGSLAQLEGVQCLKHSPPEAGLVSFQLSGQSHQQVVASLEEQGFFLRTLSDPDCIRACVHYFTLPAEIEQLVEKLKEMIS
ncbi:MAG: aminotransferase class V-fold PLP-dependent enzyme [Cyanophyceae cyanobacterium]